MGHVGDSVLAPTSPCLPLSGSVPPPCRTEAFLQGVFAQSKGLQAARGAQRGLEMLGR